MRKLLLGSVFFMLILASMGIASPLGESASYTLNSSRSSLLIRSGSGEVSINRYMQSSKFGPGYEMIIDYKVKVFMRGEQKGRLAIFMPQRVFEEQFRRDLVADHPITLGSLDIDYDGMASAQDAGGNNYAQCMKMILYNIDSSYSLSKANYQDIIILSFEHSGSILSLRDLVIKMRSVYTLPALGAVQIDISGVSDNGVSFDVGMDLLPQ